jgi:hypothetical protein
VDQQEFLSNVVTTKEGRLHIFSRAKGDQYIDYPNERLPTLTHDAYFSPHLTTPDNTILPTCTLALDIDAADLLYLPLVPTMLIQTSPTRHQAYFIFDSKIDELTSRLMALSIPGVDQSTHKFGSLLRLPYTLNTKYPVPFPVQIEQNNHLTHRLEDLLPDTSPYEPYTEADLSIALPDNTGFKPLAFMDQAKIPAVVSSQYLVQVPDPLPTLRQLILECIKAGVPRDKTYLLALGSANNVFTKLQYNSERELLKFILNLEQIAHKPDIRPQLNRIRSMTPTQEARAEGVSITVQMAMRDYGEFSHTREGSLWYCPKTGGPVQVSRRSERLINYLNTEYGLNASDSDTEHVMHDLIAFTAKLPQRSHEARLSHYDRQSNHLLVHTGANQVFSITPNEIKLVPNGSNGIIFHPMHDIFVPFMPRPNTEPADKHWSEQLLNVGPFLKNVTNLSPDEARTLMATWFMFTFFKNVAGSRPLLAIMGQPGSGKTTAFMRLSTLLYGKISGIAGVTTPDQFDQGVSSFPIFVLDNVDTWERWLPDRLAQSAATIDNVKKKLYTDTDTVIMRRDALLAITAHDPKFGRADVADRLLILNMKRIDDTDFLADEGLLDIPRATMWGQILYDLQNILRTAPPTIEEHLRIQDFAELGAWIAAGMGLLPHFRSALVKLRSTQKTFAMSGDMALVEALTLFSERQVTPIKMSPHELYSKLEFFSKDPQAFGRRIRNAAALDNKLWAMQDALKQILNIEAITDEFGRRTWSIAAK